MTIAGEVDGVTVTREWIFQGAHLRAYCDNPTCRRARASFDHRLNGRRNFDPPQLFGGVVRHGFASLVIQSAQNDYYLNPDLPPLRRVLRDYVARFDDVSGIGFSMGGFAALLLSKALKCSHVFLVSPMSPSFPKLPPYLGDMGGELAAFDTMDPQGLAGAQELTGISRDLRGVVIFDPHYGQRRDMEYARLIQGAAPAIALLAMPWGGHPASVFLSECDRYSHLQRATFVDEITAPPLKAVQRKFRLKSDRYATQLKSYLQNR